MGGGYLLEALKDTKRLQRLVVSPFMSRDIFTQIVTAFPNVAPAKKGKKGKKKVVKKKKK
jgi:hypothetical protein